MGKGLRECKSQAGSVGGIPEEETQDSAQRAEDAGTYASARKAAFTVSWWEDVVDKEAFPVKTRCAAQAKDEELAALSKPLTSETEELEAELPFTKSDPLE
ncbi:hypothetical protein DXG01_005287 [Tephrocybe rancida]|nr:hypothetical protein DXG01_005287 [Tephrocybe rancida]